MHIPPLLDELKLKAQASFFKMTMLANSATTMTPPLDCNPCFRMWALLTINQIICSKLLEWLKLVEPSMVMVLSTMEDERCFSNLFFTKSKLKNQLTTHLDLVVKIYARNFYTMETFPFTVALISWDQ
jgi:hypothetical protein